MKCIFCECIEDSQILAETDHFFMVYDINPIQKGHLLIISCLLYTSPSGYTQKAANYLMAEYERLGYHPQKTVKGGVWWIWKAAT